MMTRWLAYIRLFDFTLKHNPPLIMHPLLRSCFQVYVDGDYEEDDMVDDYFDAKLYSIQLSTTTTHDPNARIYLQEGEYDGERLTIGRYLETMERPPDLTDQEFRKLRRKAHRYLVRDGYRYKRSKQCGITLDGCNGRRWG